MQHQLDDQTVLSESPLGSESTTEAQEQATPPSLLARRQLLAGLGSAMAIAALGPSLKTAAAQTEELPAQPAMRSPRHNLVQAAAEPALPNLAVIALNRMGFGPRPGDIAAFNALGSTTEAAFAAYVEQQLNPAAIDDSACDAILATYQFQTLSKSLAQLWTDHVRKEGIDWTERTRPLWETEYATFLRAAHSKRQLLEVLADHWHNHFNVYGREYWTAPVWAHYDRDVIRAHALGNFRQMVEAVAQSPAMLYFLDNQSNSGGNPNENYARELFELHTMGAENYFGVHSTTGPGNVFEHPAPKDAEGNPLLYVDDDVYGATTCFTGWRVDPDTGIFKFDNAAHFPYQKIVLGRAIPSAQGIQDGRDVLDLLCYHPGTARHIARKLCRRLISDHPPESVVQAAADTYMANLTAADQLKQVVRTILLSPEFAATWGAKIKRPFEYLISLLRASEADFAPDNSSFRWVYAQTGQELFSWQPPNGYPDFKEPWSGTMPILQRWRLCNWLINWTYGGEGTNKDEFRLRLATPANRTTSVAIVDYWSNRLLGRALPEAERTILIEFMAQGRQPTVDLPAAEITERARFMIALLFQSPSFQWR